MNESNISISQVQLNDNPYLAKMIRDVFDEHNAPKTGTVYSDPTTDDLFSFFRKPKSVLWVARNDDKIVGCCGIYPTEGLENDCVELVKFYLPQSSRGKGIGKILMEKSINSAIEFGYKKIYLECLTNFAKAVKIYKKNGFKYLNKPMGISGHTTCNIWMIKDL